MKAQRGATWCLALSLIGLGVCGYLINGVRMTGVITPATFEDLAAILRESR